MLLKEKSQHVYLRSYYLFSTAYTQAEPLKVTVRIFRSAHHQRLRGCWTYRVGHLLLQEPQHALLHERGRAAGEKKREKKKGNEIRVTERER